MYARIRTTPVQNKTKERKKEKVIKIIIYDETKETKEKKNANAYAMCFLVRDNVARKKRKKEKSKKNFRRNP